MVPAYDVIVVGAGHAGCEAAAAAANLGSKTLLITMDMTKFGYMSCNPAMGGIAKGQIVREIDALGGYAGIITDQATIQFKLLNKSKGPAMWSPRAQTDRMKFSELWRQKLESIEKLDLWQDLVTRLLLKNNKVIGVKTQIGVEFRSKTVILTNGTFLNGLIHIGQQKIQGGRIGDPASHGISEQLLEQGFKVGRLKTGTPARLDGRTVDFSEMTEQQGDKVVGKFSFLPTIKSELAQKSCWLTNTNSEAHRVLKTGFNDSPLFNGTIKGQGPRYCPSIETKLVTFAKKKSHQLFLEPDGETTIEYYLNGFSSSLPWEIQLSALRLIPGLKDVKIFRPGYAIEYDYFDPTQLNPSLETKLIKNLFFAGQINGTTGYEEAGAQGIIAGINAHLKSQNCGPEFILNRDDAYIGVLIDDLVTKGIDEPYRMFTSRAEFRILLRQDNADARLTEKSYTLGLASYERNRLLKEKILQRDKLIDLIFRFSVEPEIINRILIAKNSAEIKQKTKLRDIVLRPEISIFDFIENIDSFRNILDFISKDRYYEIIESAEIKMKYFGYIERERIIAQKVMKLDNVKIDKDINYDKLNSLSMEARQKLKLFNPNTIGQAKRISGVSPSDINILLVFLNKHGSTWNVTQV
jgi:tRNA uridine 5-carboxymethylaminomethyl modification enzyme